MIDLRLGDCLEVLPTLADKSIDAFITDLPYGTTACAWDSVIPFDPMWVQVKRLLKPRGVFVTTASQPFTSALVMSNREWFKYCMVWDKVGTVGYLDANRRPLKRHEDICVFSANGHTYNPIMGKGEPYKFLTRKSPAEQYNEHRRIGGENNGERYPTTIIQVSNANFKERSKEHPTQKPVALYEYLIRTYTNPGDVVCDFVMGSGTTGVAAVNTGRDFIGVELRQDYFEIAQRRIEQAQAQMTLELAA